MNSAQLHAALQWQIDAGCDECVDDQPIDRFQVVENVAPLGIAAAAKPEAAR